MAKQTGSTQYSTQDKCDYYKRRANDKKLTDKQRAYAQKRLSQLCGGKTPGKQSTSVTYTDGQKSAYSAGIAYGAAKSGKRVPVKDENKDSFRAGVKRGKQLK